MPVLCGTPHSNSHLTQEWFRSIIIESDRLSRQGFGLMKTVATKISDQLDREIDALVERGWFSTRDAIVQEAIRRFLDTHRPKLMERFVREDAEWGLRGRS
jgi:hypothetical protein